MDIRGPKRIHPVLYKPTTKYSKSRKYSNNKGTGYKWKKNDCYSISLWPWKNCAYCEFNRLFR